MPSTSNQPGLLLRTWNVLLSPYRLFKFACFSVGFTVVILVLTGWVYLFFQYRSLPKLAQMDFQNLKTLATQKVHSRLEVKRPYSWTGISEIHRDYLYSIVMSEDSGFFEHSGLNVDAMIDSLAENIKERRLAYGASTITQQVVKNLFLTQEKSFLRKLKEIIITRSLEKRFSKNQILELYLNLAEFGPDLYGVRAAATRYFGKTPSEINAAEGAFLALMLPSPRRNHYAIFQNKNLTSARRHKIHRVLNDLLYNEYISEEQYRKYRHYDFFAATRSARGIGSER